MKLLAGLLFLLFLFPSAHALSLDLDSVYDQSETIVAEIQGVVLQPISPSQVTFTRGHVETVVTHDVQRLGDSYFIYFILKTNVVSLLSFINYYAPKFIFLI